MYYILPVDVSSIIYYYSVHYDILLCVVMCFYRKYVIADTRFLRIMYFTVRCIIYYYYDLLLFYIEFQKFPSVRLDLYTTRALRFVRKHTTASADKGWGFGMGAWTKHIWIITRGVVPPKLTKYVCSVHEKRKS